MYLVETAMKYLYAVTRSKAKLIFEPQLEFLFWNPDITSYFGDVVEQ
jgi:hypothetical protein